MSEVKSGMGGGKTSVKSNGYAKTLAVFIFCLILGRFSFVVKAEKEEISNVKYDKVITMCEKLKDEFLKNDVLAAKNDSCAILDCNCDNDVCADTLKLIINGCLEKLKTYKNGK